MMSATACRAVSRDAADRCPLECIATMRFTRQARSSPGAVSGNNHTVTCDEPPIVRAGKQETLC